ncbi:MAG: Homoserine O-succinyltransferase (EC [uncultured Thiotrichaceae bacterium]|uniref:Homoserine O-succinyltransferase n=1 Tax=uncultured Thiotrichaceae bacterium TaxID=298394 RepID=A0A6S6SV58_9GAMM|nr:MAG: Homoserine O-succinyltransferase (EC [uncultured Thiotrichaceae bacterium]
MPLVAHNNLPTFQRLTEEGQTVLGKNRAHTQHIREQHIGLLNMMPDAAIQATERQFYRLVGESNPIVQIYMHPFTLPELERSQKAQAHIDQYYETFEDIQLDGLDALIITGANVTQPNLSDEVFWEPLTKVFEWAHNNVASVLCSCLATHAIMEFAHGQKRRHMSNKRWGVYPHHVTDKSHPLVRDINTRFDVPHSRFNQVDRSQFENANVKILCESEEAGVHLAVSEDGIQTVYFQGHPEYDVISLLKEYKREIMRFIKGDLNAPPPFPDHYFDDITKAIFREYLQKIAEALACHSEIPEFPESLIIDHLYNTWHDTGEAVIGNWLGLVYQLTNPDRTLRFMDGVDPNNPLESL